MRTRAIALVGFVLFWSIPIAYGQFGESATGAEIALKSSIGIPIIYIEGEIKRGDYKKFLKTVVEAGPKVSKVSLMSPGGDAEEAMKIGRLIRALRLETDVPVIPLPEGLKCIPEPADPKNCICASSCFLIFVGGTHRYASSLGVHRIFFKHEVLAEVSATEALAGARALRQQVADYMSEMGVPRMMTDRIFSIPSNEIQFLERREIDQYLAGDIEEFSEWIKAQCTKETRYDNEMMAIHYRKEAGLATSSEVELLNRNPQFYLKKAGCQMDARDRYRSEVWASETKRALKELEPKPTSWFKFW
jgi:hypothetical protein